ncbi:hypothetical protein HN670_02940, partial [bacterium]|nr:hypothetical protein [bacterium]
MYFTRRHNNQHLISNFRISALQGFIFLLVVAIIGRLFYLQVIQHDKYVKIAAQQHQSIEILLPERGEIFAHKDNQDDTQFYPLAVNQITYEVFANPTEILRPQNITDILVETLDLEPEIILDKLKKTNDQYESIQKNVTEIQINDLQTKLDLVIADINKDKAEDEQVYTTGIHWNKEVLRYYPDKEIGAHVLGFLGYDNNGVNRVGKYGLEGYWQEELAGSGSQLLADRAGGGRLLPFSALQAYAKDGADLTLTIDRTVQYQACKSLEKSVALYDAVGGSVIIMETDTGAIRAMCTFPTFDPNEYNQVETVDVYNNQAVYHAYEPGSVMKAIAMAIAIDTGKVTSDTAFQNGVSL